MDLHWSEEQVATLRRLWAEGKSSGHIAMALSCSRNAVLGKVHRLGLNRCRPSKPVPAPGRYVPYSEQERRTIADMARAGEGPTAIAKALGNGRAMNAVAGDRTYIEARRHFLAQQAESATLSRVAPTPFAPTVGIESVRRNGISLARVRGIFEAQA